MSSSDKNDDQLRMGISIWISFCLFLCIWFLSRFVRGRRQLRNNLHIIEDGLRRMQEEIERRQRENSITYGEGEEKLGELLQQHISNKSKQNEDEKNQEMAKQASDEQATKEETPPETDKKND